MRKYKKPLTAGCIALLFAFIFSPVYAENTTTLNEALRSSKIQFGMYGSLPVVKDISRYAKDKTFRTLIAQGKGLRIEIEAITPLKKDDALAYSESKYAIVEGLYGPQVIPYPAQITNVTEPPKDKKPKKATVRIMGSPVDVLLANASERYVLGVWEDDQIQQKAAYAMLYTGDTKTSYEIIVFKPARPGFFSRFFRRRNSLKILESIRKIP